jgi:hypothetical protein
MKPKEIAAVIGFVGLAWHVLSLVKDAERYEINLNRWRSAPTGRNLVGLLLAEGILIEDISWF